MENTPRALSPEGFQHAAQAAANDIEKVLEVFQSQVHRPESHVFSVAELKVIGSALALFPQSGAPLFFPIDGHGLILGRFPQDSISALLTSFDCNDVETLQVADPVPLCAECKVQVTRLTRPASGTEYEDLRQQFPKGFDLFLRAHGEALEQKPFAEALQQLPSAVLQSLSVTQQADLLEMILQARQTDALQVRVTPEQAPSSNELVVYGAGQAVPASGWVALFTRVLERHGLRLRYYAQTPPSFEQPTIRAFCARCEPDEVKGLAVESSVHVEALARDLRLLGVFSESDRVQSTLVDTGRVRGDLAAVLRAMIRFSHQGLLYYDAFEFNLANCEDAFCAHPEIVETLLEAFEKRFHPTDYSDSAYQALVVQIQELIDRLSTGHEATDRRRRLILQQGLSFVEHILKTTFYSAVPGLSFRIDPAYLARLPSAVLEKFPEVPYGIFLLFNSHALGFHIRFRDLARGGLRTVIPHQLEQLVIERNQIFQEGYNLAFTQQKKNKDIPEGGAKGILLLNPFERAQRDRTLFDRLLAKQTLTEDQRSKLRNDWMALARIQGLYQAQRQYIEGLLALVNCDDQGRLRDTHIRDLYGKPEYLYIGPDENMHNQMLVWIADTAKHLGYRPGSAFISSKPGIGINHKEYGVTSLGVHVYVTEVLRYLGIEPAQSSYTVKMSGGPDGDVAGNEMVNLFKTAPRTCALLSTIDGSGTILDPQGLNLAELDRLFHHAQAIREYPMDLLHDGGVFIDSRAQKDQPHGPPLMLRKRKEGSRIVEEWIPQSEAFALLRSTMFQTQADLFIPAGGRPRTLNETNIEEFCLAGGEPSVRAIVEGANLFLTPKARRYLEERGVLIIKDSSANKGGVICSSFEVLLGLTLTEAEFLQLKPQLMPEVLDLIRQKALNEAQLLLRSHEETGKYLTDLSDLVSDRINLYKDQLLRYFATATLDLTPGSPLAKVLLEYCPKTLRERFADRVLHQLPPTHQKAILACQIASQTVYRRGLDWSPSIVDVMSLVMADLVGGFEQ